METDNIERPEIVDAETPETTEGWEELIWETCEEFIAITNGKSGRRSRGLHLSPFTFPGGDAEGPENPMKHDNDEHDEPYPYCQNEGMKKAPRRKSVAVYPVGYRGVCRNCLAIFEYYHRNGEPTPDLRPNYTKDQADLANNIHGDD